jgi:hypothetical protein
MQRLYKIQRLFERSIGSKRQERWDSFPSAPVFLSPLKTANAIRQRMRGWQ